MSISPSKLLLITALVLFSSLEAFTQTPNSTNSAWIGKVLVELQTIKVGMTRAEMKKVFKEEGGLSTATRRTYVYRDCPYIKVDFEFAQRGKQPKNAVDRAVNESEQDIITKMSIPYLAFATRD